MKFEKFISFSLLNALLLLVMAVTIASCQKNTVHKAGLFTRFEDQDNARTPASIPSQSKQTTFNHAQDSKQIYIYCYQSSLKVKQCYEHHFNQLLNDFIGEHGDLNGEQVTKLKELNQFEIVKEQVHSIEKNILGKIEPKITDLVAKRLEFCKVNASNLEKCMTQYLDRDSLALLNAFQMKSRAMNGHEYIYLKNSIQNDLKSKLIASAQLTHQ